MFREIKWKIEVSKEVKVRIRIEVVIYSKYFPAVLGDQIGPLCLKYWLDQREIRGITFLSIHLFFIHKSVSKFKNKIYLVYIFILPIFPVMVEM